MKRRNKMLNRISKKAWAGIAAVLVIVIGLFAFSTTVSNAMTLKEATDLASSKMSANAEYINGEEGDNKFEIMFHDKDLGMKYQVEISKKTEEIKKIEAEADNERAGKKVVLKPADIHNLILEKFPGTTSVQIELEKEHGLYSYDADFTAASFYGEAEINAETGEFMEYTVKMGTAVTVPEHDNTEAEGFISYEKAKEIALKAAGKGNISDIELDEENGKYYYEVEVLDGTTEYDYVIDAKTGKITSEDEFEQFFENKDDDRDFDDDDDEVIDDRDDDRDIDDDDDDDDKVINNQSSQGSQSSENKADKPVKQEQKKEMISKEKAIEIALKKAPGAKVTEIELEKDDGRYIYEIDAEDGTYEYEFEIDAVSGVIIEYDKETLEIDD